MDDKIEEAYNRLFTTNIISDIITKRKERGLDSFNTKEILQLLHYFARSWDNSSCYWFMVTNGIGKLERAEANKIIAQ